jgi:hypothetical protein
VDIFHECTLEKLMWLYLRHSFQNSKVLDFWVGEFCGKGGASLGFGNRRGLGKVMLAGE